MVYAYIVIAILIISAYLLWLRRKEDVQEGDRKMPQGLQVFDENGNINVNIQDRLCKVLGTFDTGTSNGRVNDSRLDAGTMWIVPYYAEVPDDYNVASMGWGIDETRMFPQYTQVSGGITWTFPTQTNWKVRQKCYYGIY